MPGFLIPPHYQNETPNNSETNIVSIIFGFCISLGFFTAAKAGYQSWDAYKRGKMFNAYIIVSDAHTSAFPRLGGSLDV